MWQPIETAPQDGSMFLALCGRTVSTCWIVERPEKRETITTGVWPFKTKEERVVRESGFYLEHVTDGGSVIYVNAGRWLGMPPTHWMPIP